MGVDSWCDLVEARPARVCTPMASSSGCSNCIRNSKFWNNDTTHIRVQNCCGQPPIGGLTIENNWFDRPTGLGGERRWNAIDLDSVVPNLLVRNNSFHPQAGIAFGGSWTGANASIVGNVSSQPWSGCQAGSIIEVTSGCLGLVKRGGYTCGSGDKLVQLSEVATSLRSTGAVWTITCRPAARQSGPTTGVAGRRHRPSDPFRLVRRRLDQR